MSFVSTPSPSSSSQLCARTVLTKTRSASCPVCLLSRKSLAVFDVFPDYIQDQLLLDRDSHGNVQLSRIETERCIIDLISERLNVLAPEYTLNALPHFYGYEGRCANPTKKDAVLCTQLGEIAGSLALQSMTGYMAGYNANKPSPNSFAIPIAGLLTMENRMGVPLAVIKKSIVSID